MWKLIFGGIILLFVIGAVFLAGFVVGSAASPLAAAAAAVEVVTPHA